MSWLYRGAKPGGIRLRPVSRILMALAMAWGTVGVPAQAALLITEAMSSGSVADWFELTNTGTSPVDLTGYKMDDSSASFASAVPMVGIKSIAPGESVLFVDGDAATVSSFKASWAGCVDNVQIGSYTGSGVGLSSGGDGVTVFDDAGTEQSLQTFGAATSDTSFYFTVDNEGSSNLSTSGSHGAFTCANNSDIGSPGISDTSGTVVKPGAPGVAAASAIGQNGFTANWTAPSAGGTPTGYVVEVSADGFSTVLQTLTTDGSATSVAVSGLTASTAYAYRVHAINTGGAGISSANQPVSTLVGNTPPTTTLADNTAYSGVIGDATDPVATVGIGFTVNDDFTSPGSVNVTASSSNTAVVPNNPANLIVNNSSGTVSLKIVPTGVGYADITVTVTDDDATPLSITRTIHYAASANTASTINTHWYAGRSDGSTAIPLSDGTTMLVGDDEAPAADAAANALPGGNALSAYSRTNSGMPLASLILDNLNSGLNLNDPSMQSYAQCTAAGYTGVEDNNCKSDGELDIESSFAIGNRIYVAGSLSNNKNGHSRPDRWRFFAVDESGSASSTSLVLDGYYRFLREDLRTWDSSNDHGLGADYFGLVASSNGGANQGPEESTLDGFSLEGMTTSPDNSSAWLGFRAPLVAAPGQPAVTAKDASGRVDALIVPVTNFDVLATAANGGSKGTATFGAPIRLDLGGRGIREIRKNAANQYLIIAGPPDGATGSAPHDFRLYTWDGSVGASGLATNLHLSAADLASITSPNTQCSTEGIVDLPADLNAGGTVQIISDCGDATFYGDATEAKDLTYNEWKKFRVDQISVPALPTQTITFGALSNRTLGSGTFTVSATGGASGNPVTFAAQTTAVCQTGGTNGTTVTLATTGTCTIRASQAGDTTYGAAPDVDQSFNVTLPSGASSTVTSSGSGNGRVSGGNWAFSPSGTGVLQTAGFIPLTGHPKSPPNSPPGYTFPFGLFDFVLLNGANGSTATISVTYPSALPASAVYWKYGPTPSDHSYHWYILPVVFSPDRMTATLSITDGGLGDDDLLANGTIVDQGGPGIPAAAIPGLSIWGVIMLSILLILGTFVIRRRQNK
jgi:trimeric autotransporter adhesin